MIEEQADPGYRKALFVNSCVAAVLGSGLMVLLHELIHLITGLIMGIPGTLYSFGVEHSGTHVQNAILAGSAPIFSLVSGAIMIAWQPLRQERGFAHLLWLWFAFASMMEGIGYLGITPFGVGDTGMVVREMRWPTVVAWVFFAVGILGQFWLARRFAVPLGRIAGRDMAVRRAGGVWPWLVATVVNAVLTFISLSTASMGLTDGDRAAIVAAGCATLVFAPMAHIFGKVSDAQPHEPLRLPAVPIAGVVALVVLSVVNQLLNRGLSVG